MKYIPTQRDIDLIKSAAAKEAVPKISLGAVILEPGLRSNTKSARGESVNVLLVSDDPEWRDTDLYDYGAWADFRRGVPLTDEGGAVVDFYIRRRGDPSHDLHGNVTIEVRGGRLTRIFGCLRDYFNESGNPT
jgi:hypothetical protein